MISVMRRHSQGWRKWLLNKWVLPKRGKNSAASLKMCNIRVRYISLPGMVKKSQQLFPFRCTRIGKKQRKSFFDQIREIQEKTDLGPQEASQLAAEAVAAVRSVKDQTSWLLLLDTNVIISALLSAGVPQLKSSIFGKQGFLMLLYRPHFSTS